VWVHNSNSLTHFLTASEFPKHGTCSRLVILDLNKGFYSWKKLGPALPQFRVLLRKELREHNLVVDIVIYQLHLLHIAFQVFLFLFAHMHPRVMSLVRQTGFCTSMMGVLSPLGLFFHVSRPTYPCLQLVLFMESFSLCSNTTLYQKPPSTIPLYRRWIPA